MTERDEAEAPRPTAPRSVASRARRMEPDRGALILVLGILGLVACFLLGLFAWTMGNEDLAKMNQGRMDPAGRGLTQAGKVLGILSVAWTLVGILLLFMFGAVAFS